MLQLARLDSFCLWSSVSCMNWTATHLCMCKRMHISLCRTYIVICMYMCKNVYEHLLGIWMTDFVCLEFEFVNRDSLILFLQLGICNGLWLEFFFIKGSKVCVQMSCQIVNKSVHVWLSMSSLCAIQQMFKKNHWFLGISLDFCCLLVFFQWSSFNWNWAWMKADNGNICGRKVMLHEKLWT